MQNNNRVRWAILGPGKIAHKFVHDFQFTHDADLVAVATRDRQRGETFARQYEIPLVLTYDELYRHDGIDAVYIATPHTFHFEQSLACLRHGKGVLCEKPVTINDTQFRQLMEVSKEKNAFLMEGMWSYFMPALHKAKAWINEGRIGQVKMITADFGYWMPFNPDNRIFNLLLAGGALLDLGVYPVAFSSYIMGRKPDRIIASGIIGSTGIDETTSMTFYYGDTSAVLHATVLAHTNNTGYIFGDEGFIELPFFYKASTCTLYNKERMQTDSFEDSRPSYGYDYEIQETIDCIRADQNESKLVSHQHSLMLQEIMTEVRRQIGLRYPMED
jgi:predicted dehydrogenase